MNLKKNIHLLLLLGILSVVCSCSIRKYIPAEERIYTGASVSLESDSTIANKAQLRNVLEGVLRPEPNTKFLGGYPGLFYYYKAHRENPGFINRWLYRQFGEEPVYQSDVEPYQVEELLLNRLANRGFFYSRAASKFYEEENFASVQYTVTVPEPYTMATYQLDSVPLPLYGAMAPIVANSKLEKGIRFDLSALKLERERIDNELKKKGYYNFNPGFLIFEADTNQYDRKKFDLFLRLKNDVPHEATIPYKIAQLNIHPNHDLRQDSLQTDTIRYEGKNYIQENEFFKPKYLDRYITLEEGERYDPIASKNTARRLSTIGAYKFVNIQYEEIDSLATDSIGYLRANVFLSPLNKRAIRAELKAVTKSNNFAGPALGLTFSNRNLFKGGETLNISADFGYEVQLSGGDQSGLTSIELGLENELIVPRVLFPIKIDTDFFEYAIPKTRISIGGSYLSRSKLYQLVTGTARFGYLWDANRYITHDINPISVTYTKLSNTTPEFEMILDENPFLRRSFDQQFISGLTYSFTYNGMVDAQKTHQFFLNATADVAGNSISVLGQQQDTDSAKTFLGLEYAQYAKGDIDVRYHYKFAPQQRIATRFFAGYGHAYGNSDVLPYIKQYFSGGPYSVRAFQIRSLGPGTYSGENGTDSFFDQTGNIRLEANIEYRFPLFSFLKGAVFADAGNVWLSEENDALPGGKFTGDFLNELGMGAGVGVRVDIQGFVVRFDLAAPFHDPTLPEGERFDFQWDAPVLNFAIGYPF